MGKINIKRYLLRGVIPAFGFIVSGCAMSTFNPSFEVTDETEQAMVLIGLDDVSGKVPPFLRMAWRQFDMQTKMPLDENVYTFIDTSSARTFKLPDDSTLYTALTVPAGVFVLESVVASSAFVVSSYNAQNWMTGATKSVEVSEGDIAYLGRFVFETSLNGRAVMRDHTQDANKAKEVRAMLPNVIGKMTLPELAPFSYECQRVAWTNVFKRCASPNDAMPKGHVINF